MKHCTARELRVAVAPCQGGASDVSTPVHHVVALRTHHATDLGAGRPSASARPMHTQSRMSTPSLSVLVPGDQATDALGELILDVPHRRAWTRHVGELRLMAAVLEDALNVLRKCPRSRAGREAREWVSSRHSLSLITTVHWPGSRPERSKRTTASTPAASAGSNTCGSPSTAAEGVVGWKVLTMPVLLAGRA